MRVMAQMNEPSKHLFAREMRRFTHYGFLPCRALMRRNQHSFNGLWSRELSYGSLFMILMQFSMKYSRIAAHNDSAILRASNTGI